jgi:ferredoxin
MNIELDPTACTGRGICVDAAPELLTLDEWGFPILSDGSNRLSGQLEHKDRKHAKRATKVCPMLALRLQS